VYRSILALKYDGRWHHERPEIELLAESPLYVICFSCRGSFVHHTIGKQWKQNVATLYYFPKDAFYNVYWQSSEGADKRDVDLVYCHIATPIVPCEGRLEYIDLDLDVVMRNTGQWFLEDAEEFNENAIRWGYPLDVVEKAKETAIWLMEQARALKPPFGFRRMDEVLRHYGGEYVGRSAYERLK